MSVVVTAVFRPTSGNKAALVAAMHRGIEAVHREKGCELYAIHDANDGTITMIEKWTSSDDLAAHSTGDATAILNADLAGLLESPPVVTVMTPIPVGSAPAGAL
jgi:quinol monooxygenase YgiN